MAENTMQSGVIICVWVCVRVIVIVFGIENALLFMELLIRAYLENALCVLACDDRNPLPLARMECDTRFEKPRKPDPIRPCILTHSVTLSISF